jgi:hypothetical protein
MHKSEGACTSIHAVLMPGRVWQKKLTPYINLTKPYYERINQT